VKLPPHRVILTSFESGFNHYIPVLNFNERIKELVEADTEKDKKNEKEEEHEDSQSQGGQEENISDKIIVKKNPAKKRKFERKDLAFHPQHGLLKVLSVTKNESQ
jgi:hypothetical protein